MSTWDDGAGPSKDKHKKLADKLAQKSNSEVLTSGSLVFFAYFLAVLIIFCVVLLVVTEKFGPATFPVALLLLVATVSL